jgi:hypothetical protein
VADRPLRPAMDRRLGGPLPRQQANPPRTHPRPEAEATFSHVPRRDVGPSGINPGFPGLFRCRGQVIHVLLTRSPLSPGPKPWFSLDLHVLGAPPAFVLSQDQTLREETGCLDVTRAAKRIGMGRARRTCCLPSSSTTRRSAKRSAQLKGVSSRPAEKAERS